MSEPDATAPARRRPFGVTVVIVLAWLAAIGDLVAGIWLLIVSFDKTRFASASVSAEYVRYWALVALLLGVLTGLIAYGLSNGSQLSRVLTVIVMAARVASAVWALVAIRFVTLWPAVFDLAIAILIIAMLSTGSASDYFRKRTALVPTTPGPQEPLTQEDQ